MAFSRDTLTETPCDIVLRLIPVGTGKHSIRLISFYKIDHIMKCCIIGPPATCCILCVTMMTVSCSLSYAIPSSIC